ncbi:hypothetical protein BSL78_03079 [Apostichopus japonicus]|uniref:Reverse transcriptase n=5 Tax=Stichopus japonicus TaxID=307972 RepID=A0A2G8LII9_STIJA|nr:hypothetical protein BSL78_03079 [Apostichopus japonicus]
MTSQLELEKLVSIGEKLGLKGVELKQFLDDERDKLKQERDEERDRRAKQRAIDAHEQEEDRQRQEKIEREKAKQLEIQLKIEEAKQAQAEAQAQIGNGGYHGNGSAARSRPPKLPPFNQEKDDIDAYINRFERYATLQGWDRDTVWATSLSALIQGCGLFEYSSLSLEDSKDYDKVKQALLRAYHLTADGFRKKFRDIRPAHEDTGTKYVTKLKNYLHRWMELEEVTTYEQLQDIILREQFLNSCSKDLETFLKERKPKNITTMGEFTDQYVEAHGGWYPGHSKNSRSTQNSNSTRNQNRNNGRFHNHNQKFQQQNQKGKTYSGQRSEPRKCYICDKPGHFARDCRTKRMQTMALMTDVFSDMMEKRASTLTEQNLPDKKETGGACTDIGAFMMVKPDPHLFQASKKGFFTLDCGHKLTVLTQVTAACKDQNLSSMPVQMGKIGNQSVKVLRDSGCSGVVVRSQYVKPSQMTGDVKTCILIDGTVRQYPVANILVDTPYFSGSVSALCMNDPVYDLILGNVPGVREPTNPDPNWEESQTQDQPVQPPPNVTKPMAIRNDDDPNTVAAAQTRSQSKAKEKPFKKLKVSSPIGEEVTADMLREKQQQDPTLEKIRQLAETGDDKVSKNGSTHKYVKSSGILYREFSSPRVEFGNRFRQVVVPVDYRDHVLKVAHESILGGHQGSKKTRDKVMSDFTWPGMQADVTRYCQSCDVCQRTLPKGRVTKVPLGSMPLIEEPFQRVAVDLVGPIKPATERGHRYILVLVDYATRYPEAVPMKTIEAESVAEELLGIYSRLGFPKEVLTDQGSQFVSGVMKEVSRLLSIRRLTTTPYHAMCNGLVEKFNGTLKAMLKKMCDERPKDWDRYIDPLLFAYRETPQESTGFSPFELLYGRTVRGPMRILKELWTGESEVSETKTVYQYVLDLQERLEQTCQLAREELKKSRQRYKTYYNKKARVRNMKVGEEVLLLLPTDKNKLLMQWKGPFPIVEKVGTMNYKIDFGHRVKTFHANLLKKYNRREVAATMFEMPIQSMYEVVCTSVLEDEPQEESGISELKSFFTDDLIHLPPMFQKERSTDVNISGQLGKTKTQQVQQILTEFEDSLTDLPGKTKLGEHVIKVSDTTPIRSKPYPIPHALRDDIRKEIQSMLRMGVISHSKSPYACPLVALKKPDGSLRACCDTRKINMITEFDAEPVPDQEEIFAKLSKDCYFSKIDLSKGYWQIPMAKESKPLTAFVTHDGLYEFNMMPFGLVNSGATFNRVMRKLLKGIENVHSYVDDILIHTQTWEEHLQRVKEVFTRIKKANLTARPTKCFIGYNEVEFLGHIIGEGRVKPKPDKIKAIQQAERPTTKTQVRSFLGLVGYYRKFVPNFAAVAVPLTNCTKKGEPNVIRWGESQEQAFQTLKSKLASSPILQLPDLHREFTLRTDASDTGVGAILLQEFAGEKFPVAYASKKLNKSQMRYSVMERECLAVVWAVLKFEPYLYGKEFVIETDHQPLTCIRKSKVANGRIMRWALALQPYRYRIQVIKGADNVGADYLSRSTEIMQANFLSFISKEL